MGYPDRREYSSEERYMDALGTYFRETFDSLRVVLECKYSVRRMRVSRSGQRPKTRRFEL